MLTWHRAGTEARPDCCMRVYGDRESGNCYKVRLVMAHLGRDYEWVDIDILAGESRAPEFLAKNRNGKIPLLELDDGTFLAESNAILYYLADGTELFPEERFTPTSHTRATSISPTFLGCSPGWRG